MWNGERWMRNPLVYAVISTEQVSGFERHPSPYPLPPGERASVRARRLGFPATAGKPLPSAGEDEGEGDFARQRPIPAQNLRRRVLERSQKLLDQPAERVAHCLRGLKSLLVGEPL